MPHLYLYRIQADQALLRPFLLRKVITFSAHLYPRTHVTTPSIQMPRQTSETWQAELSHVSRTDGPAGKPM